MSQSVHCVNSVFLFLLGLLGFILNAINVVSFLTVKDLRTPSNFFVFNLALADISLNVNGLTAAYASYLRYQETEDICSTGFMFLFQESIIIMEDVSLFNERSAPVFEPHHFYYSRYS